MLSFIFKRLVQGFLVLLVVSLATFALSRVSGDPAALLLPEDATTEDYAALRQALGLDKPYHVQLIYFIENAARGDLGKSIMHRRSATELYFEKLPNTVELAGLALFLSTVVAIPLGVLSAVNRGKLIDRFSGTLATWGIAAPHFWLGLIFIEIFSVLLGILPVAGKQGPLTYVMPVFTVSTFMIAGFTRLLRSSMIDVLDTDFVKLARGKGVSEKRVIWVHCLRNAITPLLSFGGVYFGLLIGGAVVTETVFAWPGIGRLAYDAIKHRDYPVIQTVVLMTALFVMIINLIVDVLYAYVDPRIRVKQ